MNHLRRDMLNIGCALLALLLAGEAVRAQETGPPQPEGQPAARPAHPRGPDGARRERPARERAEGEDGDERIGRIGELPFRPELEDRHPLVEGEDVELLAFIEQEFPPMHQLLVRLQQRNPEQFREKLERLAPRIRMLRRIFNDDAELGRVLIEHIRVGQMLQRARTEYLKVADADTRQRVQDQVRERMALVVRLECRALEARADDLARTRDARIERRVARLRSGEVDLAAEPAELRELVARTNNTADAQDAEKAVGELRERLGRLADAEIGMMRRKAARMREHAAEEVDRRVERLLKAPETQPDRP